MLISNRIGDTAATRSFERLAGAAGVLTALVGLAYTVAFVVLANALLAGLFLLLSGVLATPVLVAVHGRLWATAPGFVGWGVLLAVVGALGSAVHGAYDLANALHPLAALATDLPNPVDPRGVLTFGVAGVGLVVIAVVIVRTGGFPRWLGYLACLNGVLLVLLYLGRLVVLNPTSPLVLGPALLTGFLVNPALYTGLGVSLLRTHR